MKKLTYLIFSIVALTFVSCDNYLDRPTKTQMTDETYWASEQTVRLFVNGAYTNYFVGYNSGWSTAYIPGVRGELSDDATSTGKQSNLLLAVPADNWYNSETSSCLQRTGASAWNFAWVRKWNLMISRLETMLADGLLTDEQYNHWMGVARFFRGYEYSRLVQSFGDVPYYDQVIEFTDLDLQYKARDPRETVMTKVMEDFDFAVTNVRSASSEPNRVNNDVVAAIASRCMLFEGTWYLYHNGDEALAKTFLEKAVEYAEDVMDRELYSFDTDFRTLFGAETKQGSETILYREYSAALSVRHCVASYANLDENQSSAANLSTLKAWICQDGKTYDQSGVANVESWELKEMALTRDPRFEATFWDEPTQAGTGIYCVKFIDRIGPWYATDGWKDDPATATRPAKYASNTNTNGFPIIRYAEVVLNWIEAKAELADKFGGPAVTNTDLDESINAIRNRPLDDTAIMKGVQKTAPLTVAMAESMNDPERTSAAQQATLGYKNKGAVSPLIWEIRRERRMEFFLEQTRILDLRRWGQLELMQGATNPDILVGAWVDYNTTNTLKKKFNRLTASQFGKLKVQKLDGTIVTFDGVANDAGDINWSQTNEEDMVGFRIPDNITDRDKIEERNYLEPICTDVQNQYSDAGYKIEQNPGW